MGLPEFLQNLQMESPRGLNLDGWPNGALDTTPPAALPFDNSLYALYHRGVYHLLRLTYEI